MHCGYLLRGLETSGDCPECGAAISDSRQLWFGEVNLQVLPLLRHDLSIAVLLHADLAGMRPHRCASHVDRTSGPEFAGANGRAGRVASASGDDLRLDVHCSGTRVPAKQCCEHLDACPVWNGCARAGPDAGCRFVERRVDHRRRADDQQRVCSPRPSDLPANSISPPEDRSIDQ